MTNVRSTLIGMRNGCRSTRAALTREIENHLKRFRASAPDQFRSAGCADAIPYLDRLFDGLRDAILDGKDQVRIDLVDTRADDIDLDTADSVSAAIGGYLLALGLGGVGDWRWHDSSRVSGVKSFTIRL